MLKLSIITINYNNAIGLEKTLISIAQQSYSDYEQLIIDGGSTDGSIEIIKQYYNLAIHQFKWVSDNDNGVYHAQNKGIKQAKGEYCLFLNAGDYLVNDQVLADVFSHQTTAHIVWGNLVVFVDGKEVGHSKGKYDLSFLDVYSSMIKHQASFIKRELFDQYGLYDESLKIVADWAFFFKTLGFNEVSEQYIDVDIACFDNNGLSNNNPELCSLERQKILDTYMPSRMQEDYLLFQKYQGIRQINKSKLGWFLFRVFAKVFKTNK